jgi:hypothetical protein
MKLKPPPRRARRTAIHCRIALAYIVLSLRIIGAVSGNGLRDLMEACLRRRFDDFASNRLHCDWRLHDKPIVVTCQEVFIGY